MHGKCVITVLHSKPLLSWDIFSSQCQLGKNGQNWMERSTMHQESPIYLYDVQSLYNYQQWLFHSELDVHGPLQKNNNVLLHTTLCSLLHSVHCNIYQVGNPRIVLSYSAMLYYWWSQEGTISIQDQFLQDSKILLDKGTLLSKVLLLLLSDLLVSSNILEGIWSIHVVLLSW